MELLGHQESSESGVASFAIAYSPELEESVIFESSGASHRSIDGISWTDHTTYNFGSSVIKAIWTGSYYWVQALNGDFAWSYDGSTWNSGSTPVGHDFYGIDYRQKSGQLVHVSSSSPSVYTSKEKQNVNISSIGTKVLEVNDVDIVSSVPFSLPSYSTGNYPSDVESGSIIYSSTVSKLIFYDGTSWRQIDDNTIVS